MNPKVAIFIKYEFWFHYFEALSKQRIPLFLVSAKLTKDHLFFKWYGNFYRKVLRFPAMFFVQDEATELLLKKLQVENTLNTGDTRIDRVLEVASIGNSDKKIEQFLNSEKAIILGSSWEHEEEIIREWINSGLCKGKIIIAPHEINEKRIQDFIKSLNVETVRYTKLGLEKIDCNIQVLIVDCVGILKELYKYGSWAFIGGGFSDGIHNILEPAVFGLPIIFGPKYKKFGEAIDLIEEGGAVSISTYVGFVQQSKNLSDINELEKRSLVCSSYIKRNQGASIEVVKYINQYL